MTKNNILSFFMLISFIVACQNNVTKVVPQKAIIKYVDFEIETPINVYRNTFEKYFSKEYSSLTIEDRNFLDSLNTIIANLKPSTKGFKPDVRMIIELCYPSDSVKIICLSDIAIDLDGVEMTYDPKILSLIKTRIK
jgi:hypothetical protein